MAEQNHIHQAEVSGVPLLAAYMTPQTGLKRLFAQHGLGEPDPLAWYSLQHWVDILDKVATAPDGTEQLIYIGAAFASEMPLPPMITDIGVGMAFLDVLYQQLHRGGAGAVRVKQPGCNYVTLYNETPYPDAFWYGLLQGLLARIAPFAELNIHYENSTYTIVWQPETAVSGM